MLSIAESYEVRRGPHRHAPMNSMVAVASSTFPTIGMLSGINSINIYIEIHI